MIPDNIKQKTLNKIFIKYILLIPVFIFVLFLLPSCNTTEPPSNASIILTSEDASCTEAWLNLKVHNITLPTNIKIVGNDTTILNTRINSNDTTLYVNNLLPNKTYSIQTILESTNLKSNSVSVTTMDTTSHNFTWETFTFGGGRGSSYLNDVAIINENDIWAVGEIHTKDTDQVDSNGVWVQPYNAVHWDGQKWELKRFYFKDFCNQQTTHVYPTRAILAFSSTEIFITSGSQIIIYNGNKQNTPQCIPVSVNALWGTSSKDFYVVGNGGSIAHYNGNSWEKIESGTKLYIIDIYGAQNKTTNKTEILAIGTQYIHGDEKNIIKINKNKTELLSYNPISSTLMGVWFIPKRCYYLVGDGIYKKHNLKDRLWENIGKKITGYFTYKIRGSGINNVFIAGSYGEVLHYNGYTWESYINTTKINGNYYSLSVKKNLVAIVGYNPPSAVITIGKR